MISIHEFSTPKENYYIKKEGNILNVYLDKEAKGLIRHHINISLFHEIALYTTERKSYKKIMLKFYDKLNKENLKWFFKSKQSLENAGTAAGRIGGKVAFLLGLFCRYYNKLPRNINFVWRKCERCNGFSNCGKLSKCGDFYGCGKGVIRPLEPNFNVNTIPEIRRKIKYENLIIPDID